MSDATLQVIVFGLIVLAITGIVAYFKLREDEARGGEAPPPSGRKTLL